MSRLVATQRAQRRTQTTLDHPADAPVSQPQPQPQAVPSAAGGTMEDYLERIAKFVPAEIIAAYLAIRSFAPEPGSPDAWPAWLELGVYALLVVVTPLYLHNVSGPVARRTEQLAISTLAFIVWSYGIGGPFFWDQLQNLLHIKLFYAGIPGLLLVVWTLLAGLFDPNGNDTGGGTVSAA